MREKFELIMGLYKHHLDTMGPYNELLGEALSPIADAWYEDIYKVGEFLGVSEEWCDACFDFVYDGYCNFTLDSGEEYIAEIMDEFMYAWMH